MARYLVSDLPGLPGAHTFHVEANHVWIPGYGGGRDGPTTSDHPEQEAWMRARSGLHESWYLTWDLPDADARRRFLALIGVDEA